MTKSKIHRIIRLTIINTGLCRFVVVVFVFCSAQTKTFPMIYWVSFAFGVGLEACQRLAEWQQHHAANQQRILHVVLLLMLEKQQLNIRWRKNFRRHSADKHEETNITYLSACHFNLCCIFANLSVCLQLFSGTVHSDIMFNIFHIINKCIVK